MQLTLHWENLNVIPTVTKIYRSDAPIDRTNLGVPLVTLNNGETSWIDTNVVRGKVYYYVFEITSAHDRVVSANKKVQALPRTGPGPQDLLYGDMDLGFFGEVDASEFFSYSDIVNQLNLAWTPTVQAAQWAKVAYKNKVIYIPYRPVTVTYVSWSDLYAKGLVYGRDDAGPGLYSGTPANQKRTLRKGMEEFLVRLPKGAGGDSGLVDMATASIADSPVTEGSEWNDLFYPLFVHVPATQKTPNWANKTYVELSSMESCACQELLASNKNNFLGRGAQIDSRQGATHLRYMANNTAPATWRPFIELIPGLKLNLND